MIQPRLLRILQQFCECQCYSGDDTRIIVDSVFGNSFSECTQLACQVIDFYGDDLVICTSSEMNSSGFSPYLAPYQSEVQILLRTGSQREAESLTHELLHGKLLMAGFPYLDDEKLRRYLEHQWQFKACFNLYNIVCHELMFPLFIECGMDKHRFLMPDEVFESTGVQSRLNNTLQWWLCEWCKDWPAARQTNNMHLILWASAAEPIITSRHPTFAAKVLELEAWFERGDHRNPNTFEGAFRLLLQIIGIEPLGDDYWFHLT